MGDRIYLCAAALGLVAPMVSSAQIAPTSDVRAPSAASVADSAQPAPAQRLVLPSGAPLTVVVNNALSSQSNHVGDRFQVAVAEDVSENGVVVIPKGTIGYGEVTFSTSKGGWGKGGILGIALRYLELNGETVELDGRYREEGRQRDGAASATMFAVGIFAALVKGGASAIPKGRLLQAHTASDISYVAATLPASTSIRSVAATEARPATSSAPAPTPMNPAPVVTGPSPSNSSKSN